MLSLNPFAIQFASASQDSWWYGVPLLVRGPLLSLPIALATDYPPVQSIMVNVILSMFLIIETLSWPWKVPLLNVMDLWMTLCLMLLVTGSTLYVDVSSDSRALNNWTPVGAFWVFLHRK